GGPESREARSLQHRPGRTVHRPGLDESAGDGGVAVSMDGRGRCLDNVFVERLCRSVKYEDIYIYRYEAVPQLQQGLGRYFPYYNEERFHQSLDYRTPAAVYRE